jgi:hypothetical protein
VHRDTLGSCNRASWQILGSCDRASWHFRFMWPCIVTNFRFTWPCIVTNFRFMWSCTVTNFRFMWPCIVTNFKFMWPCIVTNFHTIKPTRCTDFVKFILEMKVYMLRTFPLSIIRSYSLYTQQWYMSYSFVDSFRSGSGWMSIPSWSIVKPSLVIYFKIRRNFLQVHFCFGYYNLVVSKYHNSYWFFERGTPFMSSYAI